MNNASLENERWSYSLMSLYGQLSRLARKQSIENEPAITKLIALLTPVDDKESLPSLYVPHYCTLTKSDAEIVFGSKYNSIGTRV